ncbi:MAG: Ku protein [Betaproteobacteria bacterium]
MSRAIWKGAIAFGLVNVPVELHSAEDRNSFKFAMLDKRDFSPVGYKRYSKTTGKEVEWADIVKGYEYEKDQFVVLSDEDFRQANVKATQTIDIKTFVDAALVSLEYFETPYYLAPSGKGVKGYALLRETLRATKRIAIAQVVIHTQEHLAAVFVHGRALILNTLRYQSELRKMDDLELPAAGLKGAGVSAKEVELARRLVDDMTEDWRPEQFRSTYQDDLMKRIKKKVKLGQLKEITEPDTSVKAERRTAQIFDLSELLKRSLGKPAGGAKTSVSAAARSSTRKAPVLGVVSRSGGVAKIARRKSPASKRKASSPAKPAAKRRRA